MRTIKDDKGNRRVRCIVTTTLDCQLLTTYALDSLLDKPDPVSLLFKCNKREIFILARIALSRYGRYSALQRVPKYFTAEQFQRAVEHVRCMFPEVD